MDLIVFLFYLLVLNVWEARKVAVGGWMKNSG